MMSAEGSKQKEQTITGKRAGTEDVCNDIRKGLLKHAALQTVGTATPSILKHL